MQCSLTEVPSLPVNVTYACPHCDATSRAEFTSDTRELACRHCGRQLAVPRGAIDGRQVRRCLVCPSTDLYVRKDFPQRLGVALVGVGVVGSSIAWYHANLLWTFGILFATALADVLLYALVGDALMCYRCNAIYRDVEEMDTHGQFDLETHEKYRQLAARMKDRSTAGL
jgi:DNA-directed RNA polymerase subunit RPC12/RpoP